MNKTARRHSSPGIKVLLADDQVVARQSYKRLLARDSKLKVIEDSDGTTRGTQPAGRETEPDVIVLDISTPGASGIETLRRVIRERPAARVLIFSAYQDAMYISRVFEAGAHGYLSKASAPELMTEAINTLAEGKRYVSPDVRQVMSGRLDATSETAMALSSRELEILRHLTRGLTLKEIGERLGVSTKTIANHQSLIKRKLGAGSALQLILIARQMGLK